MRLVFLGAAAVLGFALGGCVLGANVGTMRAADLTHGAAPGAKADVAVGRSAATQGAAFDFRFFRVESTLESLERVTGVEVTPSATTQGDKTSHAERKVWRLAVPLVSLWDFEHDEALGYPGLMKHRNSVDLWLRGATPDFDLSRGWSFGGALGWYWADHLGAALTVDVWTEPTHAVALLPSGVMVDFRGEAWGPVVGVELVLPAGEYALDIFEALLALDQKLRDRRPKR
jgi:hypothetical protein